MTILFRDTQEVDDEYRHIDMMLVNKDRQIIVNPLEDLDMDEKLAVLTHAAAPTPRDAGGSEVTRQRGLDNDSERSRARLEGARRVGENRDAVRGIGHSGHAARLASARGGGGGARAL